MSRRFGTPLLRLATPKIFFATLAILLSGAPSIPARASDSGPTLQQIERYISHSVHAPSQHGLLKTEPMLNQLTDNDTTLMPHRLGCWSNSVAQGLARNPGKDCAYGDIHASKVILLTGDSLAGMWLPTFNALGKTKHWRVVFLGMRGCAPWGSPNDPTFIMYGTITTQSCTRFSASVVTWALRHHPDAVFMAGRAYPKGRNFDKTPATGPFKVALGQSMKAFRPSGARLFVMGPTPRYAYGNVGIEAKDCILGNRPMKNCLLPPAKVVPQTEMQVEKYYNDAGRITMIDVQSLFCTTNLCTIFVNDGTKKHLIFFDSVHINRYYATYIARAIGELIGPV
jgi:hypothetical protein